MGIKILAGACIVDNNKVLLVRETVGRPQEGRWGPPGGMVEAEETPKETAIREIKHETGLVVNIIGIVQSGLMKTADDHEFLGIIYYASVEGSKKVEIDKTELDGYEWVDIDQIQADKLPLRETYLKKTLMLSLTKKPLPEYSFEIVQSKDYKRG